MAKRSRAAKTATDDTTIAALHKVAELMAATNAELENVIKSRPAVPAVPPVPAAGAAPQIMSWDDPFSELVLSINPPLATPQPLQLAAANPFVGLRVNIPDPAPPVGLYKPGTPEFRYWIVAEALTRGINFWGSLLPAGTTWTTANPMHVTLVEPGAPQLNAFYRRQFGLSFYHQKVLDFDIYSCESPDVVCHELGHAVLDALRPQLFNAANLETGAFHEAFGDISSILCSLQIPAMRKAVLAETGGRLNANSRLARLAEQLGWGLRQIRPEKVDKDCLRNAANHFFYRRPDLLPPVVSDSSLLSSEEHSFSRIFTGAFLDAFARMFASNYQQDDEAGLLRLSRDIGQIIIDAVHGAPITAAYFSQVAAAMIQVDQARFQGRYKAQLTGAFLEHGILSVASSLQMAAAPVPVPINPPMQAAPPVQQGMAATMVSGVMAGASVIYSYDDRKMDDAHSRGLDQTPDLPLLSVFIADGLSLEVHAPEEQARFAVASAAYGAAAGPGYGAAAAAGDADVMNDDAAARVFVAGLIQRQQVNLAPVTKSITGEGKKSGGQTHSLQDVGEGKRVLKRNHFACGCGSGAVGPSCT